MVPNIWDRFRFAGFWIHVSIVIEHSFKYSVGKMEITNVTEYEAIAKEKLPKMVYDYYASGAEDQWTLKENRNAFSRILYVSFHAWQSFPTKLLYFLSCVSLFIYEMNFWKWVWGDIWKTLIKYFVLGYDEF